MNNKISKLKEVNKAIDLVIAKLETRIFIDDIQISNIRRDEIISAPIFINLKK